MKSVYVLLGLFAFAVQAKEVGQTEKSMEFEVKMGPLTPMVDRPFTSDPTAPTGPYQKSFNGSAMVFGEIELDKQLFQSFGTAAIAISIGYGEKFGKATDTTTMTTATESTGLRIVPIKLLGVYRFDWAVAKFGIPLVPYVKAGLVIEPWWAVKGGSTESAEGLDGVGAKWGLAGTLGIALQIDFLDPRLARDFDSTSGVNHTYLFAEGSIEEMTIGAATQDASGNKIYPLDLSARHWMLGLSFEF
jgi:hypothetical protein